MTQIGKEGTTPPILLYIATFSFFILLISVFVVPLRSKYEGE